MPEYYQKLSEFEGFEDYSPEDKIKFGDIYADNLIASNPRYTEDPDFAVFLKEKIREDIQSELPQEEPEVQRVGFGEEFQPRLAQLVGEGVSQDISSVVQGVRGDIEAINSRGFKENLGALGENTAKVLAHTAGIVPRVATDLAQLPHFIASAALETAGLGDSSANQWLKAQYAGLERSKEHFKVFNGIAQQYETSIIEAGLVGGATGYTMRKLSINALNQASQMAATPGFSAADTAILSTWTAATGEATTVTPLMRVTEHYIDESGYNEDTKSTLKAVSPVLFGIFSGVTVENMMDRTLRNPLVVDTIVDGVRKGLAPGELEDSIRKVVDQPNILDEFAKVSNGRQPVESIDGISGGNIVSAGFRNETPIPSPRFGPEHQVTKGTLLRSDAIDASDAQEFISDIVIQAGKADDAVTARNYYMDEIYKAFGRNDLSLDDARRATALAKDPQNGWLFGANRDEIIRGLDNLGANGQENSSLGTWSTAFLNNTDGYADTRFLRTVAAHSIPLLTGFENRDGSIQWNANKYLKEGAIYNLIGFGGPLAYRRLKGGKVVRGIGSKVSQKFWSGVNHPLIEKYAGPLNKLRPTEGLDPEVVKISKDFKKTQRNIRRKLDQNAIDLKKNFTNEELEMISDFIEKEGNWEDVPLLLQEQATKIQGLMGQIRGMLIDSGIAEEAVSKYGDEYLHRVYLPSIMKKTSYKNIGKNLKSIYGHYTKRRGKDANITKKLSQMNLNKRGIKKGDKVYTALDDELNKRWIHESQTEELDALREAGELKEWEIVETGRKIVANTPYTKTEREAMGEARNVALRLGVFFREVSHDISLGQMFKHIHDDDSLTFKNVNNLSQKEFEKYAKEQGFVKINNTFTNSGIAKYGKLNGQWVKPDVKKVMENMTRKRYESAYREAWNTLHSKALTTWKIAHTAYNPSTHALNVVSNLHLCGMEDHDPVVTIYDGIRQLIKRGQYFDEAIEQGLKDSGVAEGDWNLKDFENSTKNISRDMHDYPLIANAMFKAYRGAKAVGKLPMKVYQWEDEVFKMGVFTKYRELGESPEYAMAKANDIFFDYSDVPSGVEFLRDTGIIPFISYTYKVIPVIARTAADHPERILGMMYAYKVATDLSYELQFSDKAKQQQELERELRPDYQKSGLFGSSVDSQVRLKNDPETGEARTLGIGRFIPGSDLFSDMGNAFPFGFHPAISAIYAMASGKHATFDNPIVKYQDPKNSFEEAENFDGWMKFATNTLLPNVPGIPYTYSSERVGNALVANGTINENSGWLWDFAQRRGWNGKDYFGHDADLSDELLSSIGIKINRLDVEEAASREANRITRSFGTAERKLRSQLRSPKATPSRTERALKGYAEEVDDANAKMERLNRLIGNAR